MDEKCLKGKKLERKIGHRCQQDMGLLRDAERTKITDSEVSKSLSDLGNRKR
jgi:hypothetical protein